jgi:hypothetical protein
MQKHPHFFVGVFIFGKGCETTMKFLSVRKCLYILLLSHLFGYIFTIIQTGWILSTVKHSAKNGEHYE